MTTKTKTSAELEDGEEFQPTRDSYIIWLTSTLFLDVCVRWGDCSVYLLHQHGDHEIIGVHFKFSPARGLYRIHGNDDTHTEVEQFLTGIRSETSLEDVAHTLSRFWLERHKGKARAA